MGETRTLAIILHYGATVVACISAWLWVWRAFYDVQPVLATGHALLLAYTLFCANDARKEMR